jgi:hypothetical protein
MGRLSTLTTPFCSTLRHAPGSGTVPDDRAHSPSEREVTLMAFRKVVRRLLSMVDALNGYWKCADAASPASSQARLTRPDLEPLEERTVPTVTLTGPDANGIASITNDATAETIRIDTTTNAGNITVTTTTNPPVNGGGWTIAANTGKISVNGIRELNITSTTSLLNMVVNDMSGAAPLREIVYTGGATTNPVVNLGQTTFNPVAGFNATAKTNNPNIYYDILLGGGNTAFGASDSGVTVLNFIDTATNVTTTIQPDATNTKFALNFKALSSKVTVNLNANPGAQVASYTNESINLAAGSNANNITGVVGTNQNDTLIGNDQANILLGLGGSDTIISNGGNDELAADRDFSPALAGTPTAVASGGFVNVVTRGKTIVDLTTFANISAQFLAANTANGNSAGAQVASALYNSFGFFNFGEGVAATNNGGNVTSASAAADFNTANGIVPAAASKDTLIAGDGNDGLYGFNGTAVTARCGSGNSVFSANTGALPSTYIGGAGFVTMIGAPGFTLQAGSGGSNMSFAVANVAATQPLVSFAIGGAGNDTITAGFKNVTVDAGQGTDTVTIANDPSNVLIFNAETQFVGTPLSGLGLVQKAQRPG